MVLLDRCALVFLLIGLTACLHRQIVSSSDPLLAFESACLRGQLVTAGTQAADTCMDMTNDMARAAAKPTSLVSDASSERLRITAESYEHGTIVSLTLKGRIGAGDAARFDAALSRLATRYPSAHGVIMLDSSGGAEAEAEAIAASISASGISVLVDRGAQCRSACFTMFAAARQKLVSPSASIGATMAHLSLPAMQSLGATIVAESS
jgi:membrane-bound ClpP family serine protease